MDHEIKTKADFKRAVKGKKVEVYVPVGGVADVPVFISQSDGWRIARVAIEGGLLPVAEDYGRTVVLTVL